MWQAGLAVGATLLHYLYGGWSLPLQILVTFIIADYLTGVAAAFVGRRLSSDACGQGIARKIGIMVLVALAHLLDTGLGMEAPILQTTAIWFYVGNEGLSILENLTEIGVPVPEPIRGALDKLKADNSKSTSREG